MTPKTTSSPGRPLSRASQRSQPLAFRPPVRVQRVALFEREIRERLSKAALDLLFARAEVISEGQRATRAGKPVYFGSTMLTLDLTAVAGAVRDSCDAGTARRLATLLRTDAGAATRIKSIAGREANRICGSKPKSVSTELRIEARGARVLIDVDVEGTL